MLEGQNKKGKGKIQQILVWGLLSLYWETELESFHIMIYISSLGNGLISGSHLPFLFEICSLVLI